VSRLPNVHSLAVIAMLCLQIAGNFGSAFSEEKPPTMPPAIKMTIPSAIEPTTTKSLIIRGLQLDQITAIACTEDVTPISLGIVRKEKSAPPEKVEANDVGDTQAEVSLSIPGDFTGDSLTITVSSENGTSERFRIPVISGGNLIAESEPNDSLRKAQPIKIGTTIQALVSQPKDVDVYEFHGTAGQVLVAEVTADRIGSPCDSQLTLFDSSGQILKIADDSPGSCDAILKATLPRDDTYRIVVLEATDRGSSICTYLLRISIEAK
jgi:hypothetical protein